MPTTITHVKHPKYVVKLQKSSKPTLSEKVKKIEKVVRANKPELKTADSDVAPTPQLMANIAAGPYQFNCFPIAQGDTVSTRTGNEIRVVSVQFKGIINLGITSYVASSALGIQGNSVQAFLVQDTQTAPDAASLTVGDIWTQTSALSGAPNMVFRSLVGRGRYKILARSVIKFVDKMAPYDNTAGVITQLNPTQNCELHLYHKFKAPLKVRYNGTGTGDIQKNNVGIIFLSDYNTSTGGTSTYLGVGALRVNFTDV